MKKNILFSLLLLLSAATFSQQTTTATPLTKADYLQKSKQQNKTGLILLLGGTGCALVGSVAVAIIAKSIEAGAVTMAVGIIAVPASIPFFIASHRNKKKAINLSLKNERIPLVSKQNFVYKAVPSITLKIGL